MERNVKKNSLESLRSTNDPIIIYALTEEAEAIAYALKIME